MTLTLNMLLPSSSVSAERLGGLVDPMLFVLATAEPFICWISYVILSVFIASRMFVVAVGRRARTVKVQSSWFCSNRRRRLHRQIASALGCSSRRQREGILLLGDAIAAHALARILELAQDIIGDNIAGADNTSTDGERCSVAAEPPLRGGQHGRVLGDSSSITAPP